MVPSKIDEKFQIKINQTAYIQSKNLEITLLNVTEDSRCPSDVTCIWEGGVKVLINVIEDVENPEKFTLVTSGNVEVSALAGYGIQLIRVDPYPISTEKIQPGDYTATFIVSRTENNIPSPLKQFKSGISRQDIACKENLQLVIKWKDGSRACVKHSTADILTQRGWTWSTTLDNPIRIMAHIQTTGHGGPAGWNPTNIFWMNIKSASTAYLFSYDICNKDSCTEQNFTPLNSVNYDPDGFTLISLSDELNSKWKVGDAVHIKLLVSTSTDNKTAILLDLGNSIIIP